MEALISVSIGQYQLPGCIPDEFFNSLPESSGTGIWQSCCAP
jgi:hypothetical protein